MGAPMPIITIHLECGHDTEHVEWISGDRKITCGICSRVWILTAVKTRTTGYQTKSEIVALEMSDDS